MFVKKEPEIWAVGGGKGGIGKTILCSNIGLELSRRGYKVVLIDADFGGANLHTCLGVRSETHSLSDFFSEDDIQFVDILVATTYKGLWLCSGSKDSLDISNITYFQQQRLIKAIRSLKVDYIIIDLGAGSSMFTLDFFLIATKRILVSVPEPTSIENMYRFIKAAFYRRLKTIIDHPGVKAWFDKLMRDQLTSPPKTPAELIKAINEINPEAGNALIKEIEKFNPYLIINQIRKISDIQVGVSMTNICEKYFGFKMIYSGYIEHDEIILQSIRNRKPFLYLNQQTKTTQQLKTIIDNLIKNILFVPEGL